MRFARPALLLVLLALSGCGQPKAASPPRDNQRPTVRLTRAPSRSSDLYSYSYQMSWIGFDPDGEVIEFRYAIDPPAPSALNPEPDTAWVSTTGFGGTFHFAATSPQSPLPGQFPTAASYHVFVLKSVDDRRLVSAPVVVAFNSSTIAPEARILDPVPNSRGRLYSTPGFWITFEGRDADGSQSQDPAYFRTKLLNISSPITPALLQQYPDTLLNYYAVRNWATWDSLGPDVSRVHLTDLVPYEDYVFCVIAFDEAGAYTPYANRDLNTLLFRPIYAGTQGPLITVSNEYFYYTFTGTYDVNDRGNMLDLELPAAVPVTFRWEATSQLGAGIRSFRWVLDIEDLADGTPRTDERTDWTHWSQAASGVKSATVGPFPAGGEHRFYIESVDDNGLSSLATIRFRSIGPTFDKPLAICDDTRFSLDRRSPGSTSCIDKPIGRFPTAAELDTFLFARGGFPIRCYPAGSVSQPGLFAGYDFDTLNMRPGRSDQTPSLATLSRYRRIIWLLDGLAIDNDAAGTNLVDAMTTLRYMNTGGHPSMLVAYLRQGGEVWLAGGGAASAATMPFNVTTNDRPTRTFSAAAGELRPGRFVYDFSHWQSEFRPLIGNFTIRRNLGRLEGSPGPYAGFPGQLLAKSLANGDTLPAWRTSNGDFFVTSWLIETLVQPNAITENLSTDPLVPDLHSMLDTIFVANGGGLPTNSGIMTVYHGSDCGRVITTGFDLWSYSKSSLRGVVDGVLQGLWGMSRRTPTPPN